MSRLQEPADIVADFEDLTFGLRNQAVRVPDKRGRFKTPNRIN